MIYYHLICLKSRSQAPRPSMVAQALTKSGMITQFTEGNVTRTYFYQDLALITNTY